MFRRLKEWWRGICDRHVCKRFTSWETRYYHVRVVDKAYGVTLGETSGVYEYQERRCLDCNRLFRELTNL